MAANEIVAWLRLRDLSRFRRDAKRAEQAIKNLGDAGDDAKGPINQLGEALSSLGDDSKGAFGRTRLFGFAVGTVITALLGAIPLVIGLGGALTALAGSAGAAALGLGALAVGFAGAGLAAGAFALVAARGLADFKKVNTAFQQWQKQVGAYGRNSIQAETALQNLNGILRTIGGPSGTILDAVIAWDKFIKGFRRANSGTMIIIFHIMLDLIRAATKFTDTFAYMASTVAGAVRTSFKRFLDVMTSPGIQKTFRGLADIFVELSGPLTTAFINVFVTLLKLANKMGPALVWVANGLARMTEHFKEWVGGANLGGLLSQLNSWWELSKAIVRLMLTIFGAGAKEGQGLVDTLTDVINGWNKWLKGIEGQKALKSFFHDSVAMTKAFFSLLGKTIAFIFKVGRALLPTYTKIFDALRDGFHKFFQALKPLKPFWHNVLQPLLDGLIEGIGGAIVLAFKILIGLVKELSKALGWLGDKLGPLQPAFKTLGHIIGFVFAGSILKSLAGLGKVSALLGPMAFLFKTLRLPIVLAAGALKQFVLWGRTLVGAALGSKIASSVVGSSGLGGLMGRINNLGLAAKFRALGVKLGTIFGATIGRIAAPLVVAIVAYEVWIHRKDIMNAVQGHGEDDTISLFDVFDAPAKHKPLREGKSREIGHNLAGAIPYLASGGIVSGAGSWITGEAGPEINTLRNGRVSVVPLTPSVSAQASNASIEPSDGQRRVVVSKVYLRGRQIAEAVADEADDDRARR